MKFFSCICVVSGVIFGFGISSCNSVSDAQLPTVPAEAKQTYISTYVSDGGRKIPVYSDVIEQDPRYKRISEQINDEVDRALRFHPRREQLGFVHTFNAKKREILWSRYGIDWHPSTAFNPNIKVD